MLEGVRAGAGASWPTCSTLPPPAPRLRAPEGQSHLIRPNLQAGARSEVKSFQFQGLGWGHPTPPKRHPTPAQSDQQAPGSVHLHCVGAASLLLRELPGAVLSASCTKSHRSQSQGPKLTGLVGWGASGTAHLARSNDFAIAGPIHRYTRISLVNVRCTRRYSSG